LKFLIADTFTDSLAKLTAEEQKAAKTTAFDLQVNPAHPSLQFYKLDRAKDRRFCSVRATVVVMDCGDEVIPLQERIESVGDEADLAEVYASERQLLYVACTTARDHLLVTGVNPASELSTTCRLAGILQASMLA